MPKLFDPTQANITPPPSLFNDLELGRLARIVRQDIRGGLFDPANPYQLVEAEKDRIKRMANMIAADYFESGGVQAPRDLSGLEPPSELGTEALVGYGTPQPKTPPPYVGKGMGFADIPLYPLPQQPELTPPRMGDVRLPLSPIELEQQQKILAESPQIGPWPGERQMPLTVGTEAGAGKGGLPFVEYDMPAAERPEHQYIGDLSQTRPLSKGQKLEKVLENYSIFIPIIAASPIAGVTFLGATQFFNVVGTLAKKDKFSLLDPKGLADVFPDSTPEEIKLTVSLLQLGFEIGVAGHVVGKVGKRFHNKLLDTIYEKYIDAGWGHTRAKKKTEEMWKVIVNIAEKEGISAEKYIGAVFKAKRGTARSPLERTIGAPEGPVHGKPRGIELPPATPGPVQKGVQVATTRLAEPTTAIVPGRAVKPITPAPVQAGITEAEITAREDLREADQKEMRDRQAKEGLQFGEEKTFPIPEEARKARLDEKKRGRPGTVGASYAGPTLPEGLEWEYERGMVLTNYDKGKWSPKPAYKEDVNKALNSIREMKEQKAYLESEGMIGNMYYRDTYLDEKGTERIGELVKMDEWLDSQIKEEELFVIDHSLAGNKPIPRTESGPEAIRRAPKSAPKPTVPKGVGAPRTREKAEIEGERMRQYPKKGLTIKEKGIEMRSAIEWLRTGKPAEAETLARQHFPTAYAEFETSGRTKELHELLVKADAKLELQRGRRRGEVSKMKEYLPEGKVPTAVEEGVITPKAIQSADPTKLTKWLADVEDYRTQINELADDVTDSDVQDEIFDELERTKTLTDLINMRIGKMTGGKAATAGTMEGVEDIPGVQGATVKRMIEDIFKQYRTKLARKPGGRGYVQNPEGRHSSIYMDIMRNWPEFEKLYDSKDIRTNRRESKLYKAIRNYAIKEAQYIDPDTGMRYMAESKQMERQLAEAAVGESDLATPEALLPSEGGIFEPAFGEPALEPEGEEPLALLQDMQAATGMKNIPIENWAGRDKLALELSKLYSDFLKNSDLDDLHKLVFKLALRHSDAHYGLPASHQQIATSLAVEHEIMSPRTGKPYTKDGITRMWNRHITPAFKRSPEWHNWLTGQKRYTGKKLKDAHDEVDYFRTAFTRALAGEEDEYLNELMVGMGLFPFPTNKVFEPMFKAMSRFGHEVDKKLFRFLKRKTTMQFWTEYGHPITMKLMEYTGDAAEYRFEMGRIIRDYAELKSKHDLDKVLKEEDKIHRRLTEGQLRQRGLSPEEMKGYRSYRKAFDYAFEWTWRYALKKGADPEVVEKWKKANYLPGFVTHYRYGDIYVWTLGKHGAGEVRLEAKPFKSHYEADDYLREVQQKVEENKTIKDPRKKHRLEYPGEKGKPRNYAMTEARKVDMSKTYGGDVASFMDVLHAMPLLKNIAHKKGGEKALEEFKSFADMIHQKQWGVLAGGHFSHRKDVAGWSDEEMERAAMDYLNRVPIAIARASALPEIYEMLGKVPEEHRDTMQATIDFYMGKGPIEHKWALNTRKFLYDFYLGAKLSFGAMNLTQVWLTSIPLLHAELGSVTKAYATAGRAEKKLAGITKEVIEAKLGVGKHPKEALHEIVGDLPKLDDMQKEILQKLIRREELGASRHYEMRGMELLETRPKNQALKALDDAIGAVGYVSERVNRLTTALMFVDAGRQKGLTTEDDLYDYILLNIFKSQFPYDKAVRPEGARGDIPSILFTFKTFPFNHAYLLNDLYGKDKKSFLHALAVFFALAGAMGLPAYETIKKLLPRWMASTVRGEPTWKRMFGLTKDPTPFLQMQTSMIQKELEKKTYLGVPVWEIMLHGIPSLLGVEGSYAFGAPEIFGAAAIPMVDKAKLAYGAATGDNIDKMEALARITPPSISHAIRYWLLKEKGEWPKDIRGYPKFTRQDIKHMPKEVRPYAYYTYDNLPTGIGFVEAVLYVAGFPSRTMGKYQRDIYDVYSMAQRFTKYKQKRHDRMANILKDYFSDMEDRQTIQKMTPKRFEQAFPSILRAIEPKDAEELRKIGTEATKAGVELSYGSVLYQLKVLLDITPAMEEDYMYGGRDYKEVLEKRGAMR